MQKIDLKNAFTPFWASKSTSKTLSLHFEPQKAPQKYSLSILSLKKYLKNIFIRFWASKSTSKAFGLHFEPQKVPQEYFDSILSLKKHLKNILTRFWGSKSITKIFWDLPFSSGRIRAYCIRPTNNLGRGRKSFGINDSGIDGVRTKQHIGLSLHIGLSICPLWEHLWGVRNTPLPGYIIYMPDGYIHFLCIKGNDFHHIRRFTMG